MGIILRESQKTVVMNFPAEENLSLPRMEIAQNFFISTFSVNMLPTSLFEILSMSAISRNFNRRSSSTFTVSVTSFGICIHNFFFVINLAKRQSNNF